MGEEESYAVRGENYIRLTAAKVLTKHRDLFDPNNHTNKESIEYLNKFNKLSLEEQIDVIYNIMLYHDGVIKNYISEFKDFQIPVLGSVRRMDNRRYCINRTKELKKENPNIQPKEIFKILKAEVKQLEIEKKKNKLRNKLKKT